MLDRASKLYYSLDDMNLFQHIHEHLTHSVLPEVADMADLPENILGNITVELPRDRSHGDVSTNAAMVLSKPLSQPPRIIAESMVPFIKKLRYVKEVSIAGAGFINLTFEPAFWQQELLTILKTSDFYGASDIGQDQRINIEYVSANPTGPLHIGHARGAVVGDALARLLQKASYDVVKEYYINDAGSQVQTLGRSAYLRYRQAYGEDVTIEDGMYPGDYLIAIGKEMKEAYGGTLLGEEEDDWLPEVCQYTVDAMMQGIKDDLALIGVEHDVFTSEQTLQEDGMVEQGIETLKAENLIYNGVLPPPRGKAPHSGWDASRQTLFRSSDFGDDSDRPVIKANGEYTYFAGDIAYTQHKLDREFDTLIMVLGADHGGYVSRMKALVSALSENETTLHVMLCQLVKLMDQGEALKMSKRSGSFVTVREVAEEVGKDVLRFMMLTRKPEQLLDFDLQKVKEQSKENPVFYVQYAHARCKSVLRTAQESLPQAVRDSAIPDKVDISLLKTDAELQLMKTLASFPRVVEQAAIAYEPHRIAYFVQELAAELHTLWNKGNDDTALRFIESDNVALTTARLALARCTAIVLAAGLDIVGVTPVEEMR